MLKFMTKKYSKKLISIIFKNCKLKRYFLISAKHKWFFNSPKRRKRPQKIIIQFHSLPIFGKIFKRLISNSLFKYNDENELLNPNQSGFCLFDSCVNEPLSINHFLILTVTHQSILKIKQAYL